MTAVKQNIWEIATHYSNNLIDNNNQCDNNSNLLFIGSSNGGKTSIIYRYLDKNDLPKPTVALEYMFARKTKPRETTKNIVNIWELGGGSLFTNLMEFAITRHTLLSTAVVIVLDLSDPEELIITAETLLNAIRDCIHSILSQTKKKNFQEILKEKTLKRLEKHEDIAKINPFPVCLLIVGTKYDIFQDLDSEKKKLIVRYLRLLAHTNGAQLIFTSNKSETLLNKCRVILNNLTTDETQISSLNVTYDYTKPILITFGSDSFKLLEYESIDSVKRLYTTIFPQVITKLIIPDDPAKDLNFRERDIDLIRAQKDEDLENYMKQLEIKRKLRTN